MIDMLSDQFVATTFINPCRYLSKQFFNQPIDHLDKNDTVVNGVYADGLPLRYIRFREGHVSFEPVTKPKVEFNLDLGMVTDAIWSGDGKTTCVSIMLTPEGRSLVAKMLDKAKAETTIPGFPAALWAAWAAEGVQKPLTAVGKWWKEAEKVMAASFQSQEYTDLAQRLIKMFPAVRKQITCPGKKSVTVSGVSGELVFECGYVSDVRGVIIHLNDHDGWTREQIADWLETLDLDLTIPVPTDAAPDQGTEPEGGTQ